MSATMEYAYSHRSGTKVRKKLERLIPNSRKVLVVLSAVLVLICTGIGGGSFVFWETEGDFDRVDGGFDVHGATGYFLPAFEFAEAVTEAFRFVVSFCAILCRS